MYRKLRAVREYLFYLEGRYGSPRLRVGVVSSGVVPWRSWREKRGEREGLVMFTPVYAILLLLARHQTLLLPFSNNFTIRVS